MILDVHAPHPHEPLLGDEESNKGTGVKIKPNLMSLACKEEDVAPQGTGNHCFLCDEEVEEEGEDVEAMVSPSHAVVALATPANHPNQGPAHQMSH